MAVGLTNVTGSTVTEFMDNAGAIFGAGTLGETRPRLNVRWRTDPSGLISSATLTIAISATTAHWSGSGMRNGKPAPQPDAANRTAIDRVEAANSAHEQRHIDSYQTAFDAKKAEIEKKYIGVTTTAADAVTNEMGDALRAACEALHKTEGLITVTNQNGAFAIAVSPQGPGGCT